MMEAFDSVIYFIGAAVIVIVAAVLFCAACDFVIKAVRNQYRSADRWAAVEETSNLLREASGSFVVVSNHGDVYVRASDVANILFEIESMSRSHTPYYVSYPLPHMNNLPMMRRTETGAYEPYEFVGSWVEASSITSRGVYKPLYADKGAVISETDLSKCYEQEKESGGS